MTATTTTTRRTAKISRAYTAIRIEHLAASTKHLRCTARKAIDITGTNDGSVHLNAGETFFLIRAESLGDDMFYIVRCEVSGVKRCSCKANKPCKHEIYVAALLSAQPVVVVAAKVAPVEDFSDLIDHDQISAQSAACPRPCLPAEEIFDMGEEVIVPAWFDASERGVVTSSRWSKIDQCYVYMVQISAGEEAIGAADLRHVPAPVPSSSPVKSAPAPKRDAEPRGTLSSAAKGSFLDAVFGKSPEMQSYRQEYAKRSQAS